jgi:hypothetical protein
LSNGNFTRELCNIQSKKMQLSNRVTLPKNTPHNSDYVDCSAFPGNGIGEKSGRRTLEVPRKIRRLAVLALVE